MVYEDFIHSIESDSIPSGLSIQLQALWYEAKGEWEKGHDLIDHLTDSTSAHVHAYLHRVEGDLWNARYWYSKAKKTEFKGDLKTEWEALVKMLL
ncbi:hypothetical protein [Sphingobacterium sp. LRF_L2]|uniref:hypothetical protein n=1 Tax=Sphingobacterium sp. LRF_L2 TaxID=3369421 RepID=UPI003F5EC216